MMPAVISVDVVSSLDPTALVTRVEEKVLRAQATDLDVEVQYAAVSDHQTPRYTAMLIFRMRP